MIISIAWKNIWRNKIRSLLVIVAVAVGTMAGVFFGAWMEGMSDQKVENSIHTEVGHLEIINAKYLIDNDINNTIPDFEKLKTYLNTQKDIKAWTAHSKVEAMAQTTRANAGVELVGISPEQEKPVSDVYTHIIEGTGDYFKKKSRYPTVLIGDKLAEILCIKNYKITDENIKLMTENDLPKEVAKKLKPMVNQRFVYKKKFDKVLSKILTKEEMSDFAIKIKKYATYYGRAKITFTFTNTQGELAYLTCRVNGIYKTSNTLFDAQNIFIKKEILDQAAGLKPQQYHEVRLIANEDIDPNKIENLKDLKLGINQHFPQLKALDIKEMAPDAYMFQTLIKPKMYVIMLIIYFALAFGIINTMLMAIMERIKELGMLRAIGMNKRKIRKMIRYETVFLTLIGAIAGMILTIILVGITSKTGVNLFGDAFEDIGISTVVYPKISVDFFINTLIIVVVIAILASIIPTHKALKTKAIDALKD